MAGEDQWRLERTFVPGPDRVVPIRSVRRRVEVDFHRYGRIDRLLCQGSLVGLVRAQRHEDDQSGIDEDFSRFAKLLQSNGTGRIRSG